MKANEIPLHQFLSQNATRFLIPVYQRNYDWKHKQCAQLLSDIFTNAKDTELKPYFIGSIVYTSKSLTTSRDLIVIDGQQRITSINLLLLAIANTLEKSGDETYKEVWDYYIHNKYLNEGSKLKLKPVQKDQQAYYNIVNNSLDQIEEGNRILENYKYFVEKIDSVNNALLAYEGFKRLTIVEIGLDERDDAQKIFQSLNSTGLDLSQADLIRNYILMNLDPDTQERIYHKFWIPIENNTYAENTYTSRLSEFFRDFLTYKYKKVPAFRMIFEEFKQRNLFDLNQIESLEAILEEMKGYSSHYYKFLNPDSEQDPDIRRELYHIDQLEITVAYPYLLGVFEDYTLEKIDKKQFIDILRLIQTFTFRRFTCNLPTNALNKIFATLYENTQKLKTKYAELSFYDCTAIILVRYSSYQKLPTDVEIAENLKTRDIYNSQSKNKNYLFEMLENNYSSFSEMEINIEKSTQTSSPITIEHIFPQNPSQEWKKQLSSEEFSEMEKMTNTLANLTIVINNASLGNRSFTEKRDLNNDESKGFKYSKFHLNETLSELNKWDLFELNRRYEALLQKYLTIWKYPQINEEFLKNKEAEMEIEISELDDASNKRPEYIVFDGTKIKLDSYRAILKYIVNELLVKNPEVLFIPEIKDKLKLTKRKEDLRYPLELSQNYFIEGHFNTNHIYRNIVDLIESSEDFNSLLIKIKE